MSDLIDTTEMYLKVVFELEEQGQPALRARVAERLDQAMPSVSQTVSRLERDGLVTLDDNRIVALTVAGRDIAVAVMRKHRIAERFLFDVLGLDWAACHEEACRWEHVLGDEAEAKLLAMLTTTDSDPYGNPIPGVGGNDDVPRIGGVPVSSVGEGFHTVVALGESLQADTALLTSCAAAGIIPGATLTVSGAGDQWNIEGPTGAVTLRVHDASQLFVAAN
ncbi:MAG: metal-dependent transcriptional regulator [Microbacteriaceae bacterium]